MLKNLFKWVPGRQLGCEYRKFTIWFFSIGNFGTDCYIIHYKPNTILPTHTDPIENKKHYRLNIDILNRGTFVCKNVLFEFNRITLFRPDKEPHSVINDDKQRWIFSIGWAL